MAEAISPNRLQPDTPLKDNLAYINDNMDKTVQAINDLGGKIFDGASYSVSVAAGATATFGVSVIDSKNIYTAGRTPILPVIKTYVDNNNDDDYILGISTSSVAPYMVSVWSYYGYIPGAIAVWVVHIHNFDASSHTFYNTLNNYAFSTPATGIFR